jgi:hypothetical protein
LNITKLISVGQEKNSHPRKALSWCSSFFFDQSTAHGAFASDALNANEMKVNFGEKQCRMDSTFIPSNNPNPKLRGRPQSMKFEEDLASDDLNYQYRGQVKGMKQVLKERGL